ncbi:uncharacterized protein N7482_008914 [Penicillium canariense]|uniref:Uncharacterized protein n=1 Tax=Penicillium canariense TaxID=189055 RepID=A0A9W9LIT1_9EURO|nr:uncharacterized protein N7482_008914 [Penicillium canariense]KAJ5157814.1 hypothetical protein N7482_008914 [Penicillium canariense]
MRWASVLWLLTLTPTVVSAKVPPIWNPSFPFRPLNVTGLGPLYAWAGSYFNATAQIEIIPVVGWKNLNDSLCPSLRGKTFTTSFPSVLAITERGPYNVGTNPVNMYLTFWDPGFNFSTLGRSFPAGITGIGDLMYTSNPSLAGTLESSPQVPQCLLSERVRHSLTLTIRIVYPFSNDTVITEGMVWNSTSVADIFNLTLSPTSKAPYNLTAENGGLFLDRELVAFNATMDSCSSIESNEYLINPGAILRSGIPEGDWAYPSVNLNFDSRTANITVDGYFVGFSSLWANITRGIPTAGPTTVVGKIRLSFNGVIDTYHSDILVNNSATPQWIRTVGFGNNSLNIGYGSTAPAKIYGATGVWILSAALSVYLASLY